MTDTLPEHFFRVRDNGAAVFRVSTENRDGRIDMIPIAVVNVRNGEIRPQGNRALDARDTAAIESWMSARKAELQRRDIDDIQRTIDHLNQTAHWAQTRASDEELDEITDRMLLAMHDLRTVLVRRKSRPDDV